MPSAKTLRAQQRRAGRNKSARSFARSRLYQARAAVEEEPQSDDAATAVKSALSALDKAAGRGIIHKNAAARKKSRLQRRLNKAAAGS